MRADTKGTALEELDKELAELERKKQRQLAALKQKMREVEEAAKTKASRKRERAKAKIRRERTTQRKQETRKKILYGAMLMDWMESGRVDERKIRRGLNAFLKRPGDRAVFGLPPLGLESDPAGEPSSRPVE